MKKTAAIAIASLFLFTSSAFAADLFFYPKKGQDKAQQAKDEAECAQWAKQQAGSDTANAQAEVDREKRVGGAVRGGAKGAATGALIGAIAGDAGKGAAIGAAGGAVLGRRGAKQNEQIEAAGKRNAYQRALAACMESRGYNVK